MKILSLSGFIPEQICDTIRFEGYKDDIAISHLCQYAASYISRVLSDNSTDGAVFPKSCDSTRIIKSYLGEKDKFIYQLPIPARLDEYAIDYFSKEIKAYKEAIEAHYGIKITDIEKRADIINTRNEKLKTLYENLENFSYGDYIKSIHKMLTEPLFEQSVPELKQTNSNSKRIYLIGSFLNTEEIIDVIEELGLKIIGDNLPESGRLVSTPPVELKGDIYKNISKSILSARLSPTQNNFEKIITNDIKEIKEKNAQGVIFLTQKYCEAYDYLYSVYEKELNSQGIKSLKISLTSLEGNKKHKLALEAFSDMI